MHREIQRQFDRNRSSAINNPQHSPGQQRFFEDREIVPGPLHQFNVKNAFLHEDLKEEVYMEPPPGFSQDFRTREACRLKKALHGLKLSPRAWFGCFTVVMRKYGYTQNNYGHTLFLKRRQQGITCLIIYVDDMIITGDDRDAIQDLRKQLFQEFEIKILES